MQIKFPTYNEQVAYHNRLYMYLDDRVARDARAGVVFLLNFRQIEPRFIALHAKHEADRRRRIYELKAEGQHYAKNKICYSKRIAEAAVFHMS